jgi:hypothetical protein
MGSAAQEIRAASRRKRRNRISEQFSARVVSMLESPPYRVLSRAGRQFLHFTLRGRDRGPVNQPALPSIARGGLTATIQQTQRPAQRKGKPTRRSGPMSDSDQSGAPASSGEAMSRALSETRPVPCGLSRAEAAMYVGISPSLFDQRVRDGRNLELRADPIGNDTASAAGITAHSTAPVLVLCRQLVEAGHDPATPLHAYRGATLALKVRSIGEAAGLEINGKGNGFRRVREVDAAPLVRNSASVGSKTPPRSTGAAA